MYYIKTCPQMKLGICSMNYISLQQGKKLSIVRKKINRIFEQDKNEQGKDFIFG